MKKLMKISLISLLLLFSCEGAGKAKDVIEKEKGEEVKYEYYIGESLFKRMPVKYCHIMNGSIYVQLNESTIFTTLNQNIICIQEQI